MNILLEPIRQSITAWFEKKQLTSVRLLENLTPDNDKYSDYYISYEAVFEPSSLDQARVELWVSEKGYVGIGFESRGRAAKRLDVANRRDGFCAGYEPLLISIEALLANIECIANGKVALTVSIFPWFGLGATKAVILDENFLTLRELDDNVKYWLSPVQDFQSTFITQKQIIFSPWENRRENRGQTTIKSQSDPFSR